jgi:hypothetical protein
MWKKMKLLISFLLINLVFQDTLICVYALSNSTKIDQNDEHSKSGGRNSTVRLDDQGNRRSNEEEEEEERIHRAKQEADRIKQQDDLRRRRKQREREREGSISARSMMEAGANENCNWRSKPLSLLKGEVCGSHYKVLGLDRKRGLIHDKVEIKKAYRQKSLTVHPDKNPSPDASAAFKIVQDAYECLSDDIKRKEYENKLTFEEERIFEYRQHIKDTLIAKSIEVLYRLNYYATLAAKHVHQTAMDIWDVTGEWQVEILDEPRPLGQYLLMAALMWKGRFILQIYGISYSILRVNHELAKSGFFDQFYGF